MKVKNNKKFHIILALFLSVLTLSSPMTHLAFADEPETESSEESSSEKKLQFFSVSPMNQTISLTPGETYYGNFKIVNPADTIGNFEYTLDVKPFFVEDETFEVSFENKEDYNQITNWITLESDSGVVAPNQTQLVNFAIDVPVDAPAGGQYATIVVNSSEGSAVGSGINIKPRFSTAHLIYAEVSGETIRKGDITSVSVPSFLFSGQITASATIKNTGNVHSNATHTLQIFPLFSKEEIYTNEEDPKVLKVMPGTSRTTHIAWDSTPQMGIFHVIYNVEYEGVNSNVNKHVIVCPIWLLAIIVAAFVLLVLGFIFGAKRKR